MKISNIKGHVTKNLKHQIETEVQILLEVSYSVIK